MNTNSSVDGQLTDNTSILRSPAIIIFLLCTDWSVSNPVSKSLKKRQSPNEAYKQPPVSMWWAQYRRQCDELSTDLNVMSSVQTSIWWAQYRPQCDKLSTDLNHTRFNHFSWLTQTDNYLDLKLSERKMVTPPSPKGW